MKIAIDARFYGKENGGLGRYTTSLLNQLQEIDNKNQYYVLLRDSYFKSLKLKSNFTKVRAEARHYSFKEQLLIPFLLYKINPDVIHFLHFNVPLLFFKKNIVTIHDLLMHSGIGKEATTRNFIMFRLKRLFYRVVFDMTIYRASKIIVPTNFVKKEVQNTYRSLNSKKVIVINEGVTSTFEKGTKSLKQNQFLYVGNAYPHKNIETLLKAFSILKKKAKLILVIPNDVFTNRLKQKIKNFNLQDSVVIKTGLDDKELAGIYSSSEAFIYPSFSEGFGLQGLESMLAGTRLLASDIPVFHEVYKDNAVYFDPNDANDLARKIETVMNEKKSIREKAINKALSFVKQYSWEDMTRATLALYEER